MKNLIIVESPTKARTLSKFIGADYQIEATVGHLRDLPESKLGIEIKKLPLQGKQAPSSNSENYDFIPDYVLVEKKQEIIDKLKQEASKAEKIILATDPDREGEAIAYHVAVICSNSKFKIQNSKFTRIVFHEITESAIKEALLHPKDIDMNLVDAQQARRILDRLVGYRLSPLLWKKIRRGLSAGRVQSVTVRLIVEREREIEAFKPEEYWTIQAELEKTLPINTNTTNTTNKILATLVQKDSQKIEIKNKDEAEKTVSQLGNLEYKVKNIETQEVKKSPYPPFTTSTMQQAAANLFGWVSKHTMRVAQNLYEEGLITYHRTDSVNLSQQAILSCRQFIEKEYGQNYLPESLKIYKTKSKVAQEAHEAIRPTKIMTRSKEIELGIDSKRLYELIWKRFVACQMNEAIFAQTQVEIEASEFLFRATGSKLKFEGWKKLYGEGTNETNGANETKELPSLAIGEILKLIQLLPGQHFTEPPSRYTEATLIKTLEEKGIGRPSTYAPIISTIQERQYVEKRERKFQPTVLGTTVNDFLVKQFPSIVDFSFTAKMEDDLDSIANGENKWVPVLSEFYGPFNQKLEEVTEKAKRVAVPVEQTNEKCPQCGAPLVIRIGKFGKFLACSQFPQCKFTKTYLEKTDLKCPRCGGEIIVRKTRRGRIFYGCANYPKCDFAAWNKDKIPQPNLQSS